jgi:hypothetical protein
MSIRKRFKRFKGESNTAYLQRFIAAAMPMAVANVEAVLERSRKEHKEQLGAVLAQIQQAEIIAAEKGPEAACQYFESDNGMGRPHKQLVDAMGLFSSSNTKVSRLNYKALHDVENVFGEMVRASALLKENGKQGISLDNLRADSGSRFTREAETLKTAAEKLKTLADQMEKESRGLSDKASGLSSTFWDLLHYENPSARPGRRAAKAR